MKNRTTIIHIAFAIFTFSLVAFPPRAQAVVPPPDGGYPGGNTAEGQAALLNLTTGEFNTAVGFLSLRSATTGQLNTGVGAGALLSNTADQNTATGAGALLSNTTGASNTATGVFALGSNHNGIQNTATGFEALFFNDANGTADGNLPTGSLNAAFGCFALLNNIDGTENSAFGWNALASNINGSLNVASGSEALFGNTFGQNNTANGVRALFGNTIGGGNTASGFHALLSNSTGASNTATGANALFANTTGSSNTAIGNLALGNSTGNNNVALGALAANNVTTADNVICIGAPGTNVSNTCFIGNIRGVATVNMNAVPVVIDSAGQLGTVSSSRLFKREIQPMDKASESILGLKPVTFHYKSDATGTPQFGLIAEEVAEVNPDLVVRDENGKIYTVRYDAVNAMLLNEFLKEHRKVEKLEAAMDAVNERLKEQDAKIQKQTSD